MQRHHRRGAFRRIGHELHYIVTDDGQWIALISFSPAALHYVVRDQRISWHRCHRIDQLRLIADNSHFLIFPNTIT